MRFDHIDEHLDFDQLPQLPGVYQFIDKGDRVLYVGKARRLRNRVQSYFRFANQSPKTQSMMGQARSLDISITSTEDESLILENNLIKQHRPRYNILFRDDKSYPWIHVTDHPFPRIHCHRGAYKYPGQYFGPYPNASAVHQSLNLIQKIFSLRPCADNVFSNRSRPCLQYQIKRCSAPCTARISQQQYARDVSNAITFLKGNNHSLIKGYTEQMEAASKALDFEHAATLRDRIVALRTVSNQSHIEGSNHRIDVDVIVCCKQDKDFLVYLALVRGGKYLGGRHFIAQHSEEETAAEVLSRFVAQHYLQIRPAPEVILSHATAEMEALATALSRRWKHRLQFKTRCRGERAKWLQLSTDNARLSAQQIGGNQAIAAARVEQLQKQLQLPEPPVDLECFDVSHTQGVFTYASCVVFRHGMPDSRNYRRYKINGIRPGDDYAAMNQALARRYRRQLEEQHKLPDLIVIDGGRGQAAGAMKVLEDLGLGEVPLIAISKGKERRSGQEKLLFSWRQEELQISPQSPAFHLTQQLRDEAHRFAISGHRRRRQRAMTHSQLEDIEGVGSKIRQKLMAHFGGTKAISNAAVEELCQVSGVSPTLARRIYHFYR